MEKSTMKDDYIMYEHPDSRRKLLGVLTEREKEIKVLINSHEQELISVRELLAYIHANELDREMKECL